jgi:hypothetical protein
MCASFTQDVAFAQDANDRLVLDLPEAAALSIVRTPDAGNALRLTISGPNNDADAPGFAGRLFDAPAPPAFGTGALDIPEPRPGLFAQLGADNVARATVAGEGNALSILQAGRANIATGTVTGSGNVAAIVQAGRGNRAGFRQAGTGNALLIRQFAW